MNSVIQLVDPDRSLQIYGVRLLGINASNAKKLVFTLALIVLSALLGILLRMIAKRAMRSKGGKIAFWLTQSIHVLLAIIIVIGFFSIWFDDPARLTTAAGLVTAGLAFALQRVVLAVAGYFVILRGKAFVVGDRITMGGVRGDVLSLGFIQTCIMEMGHAPGDSDNEPSNWIKSRQYTGRIVTVTNDKVFETPVYNYTRDFAYIWEELTIPIKYGDDHRAAERILLDAANEHSSNPDEASDEDLREMERRFGVKRNDLRPRGFMRLTDNWIEITVRFLSDSHRAREIKDRMARQILEQFDAHHLAVASATMDISALPPIVITRKLEPASAISNGR